MGFVVIIKNVMMTQLAIIMPIYNGGRYLKYCLDSIQKQISKKCEIICIDDGSTDNSLKILQQYTLKDSRLKILKQNNQGAAAARNLGLSHANGKYVIFLDSDDYFEPDLIEESVAKAEEFNADIVIFRAEAFDDVTGQTSALNDRISKLPEYQQKVFSYKDIPEDIFNSFLTAPWNKLYRKSFLDKHGFKFQNIKRTNDLLFVCQTLVAAKRIILLDKVLVHYRTGNTKNLQSGNAETPLDFYKALLALKEYLDKKNLFSAVAKSYYKLALDIVFYNLNSITSDKQFKELIEFFKDKGFNALGLTENTKLYQISFLGYLQYKCAISNSVLNNVNLLRKLYKLFKAWQYFQIAGMQGLFNKIKLNLKVRSRRQCK